MSNVKKKGDTESSITNVGCDVKNCKFNDLSGGYCTAVQIDVQNRTANNKAETYCNTFLPKGSF